MQGCATEQKTHPNTKVFNMGSLHDYMLEHPKYNLSVFLDAMKQFQPDVILSEVRQSHPGVINGSIDGGIEQSLIYAFAETFDIPVIPIDWFDDEHLKMLNEESKRESLDSRVKQEIQPDFEKYVSLFKQESFETLNGPTTDTLVERIYTSRKRLGYEAAEIRNREICKNLKTAVSKYSGKKILTVFGLDHRYYLQKCSTESGAEIVKTTDFYKTNSLTEINTKIITKALFNIQTSKQELSRRLQSNDYGHEYSARLKNKLNTFDKWEDSVKSFEK